MKIVLNRAVGASFCLSQKALERLRYLKSLGDSSKLNEISLSSFSQDIAHNCSRLFARNDLDLIRVVEEMGKDAAGANAELVVIDIPRGSSWQISDVVGYEFVVADGQVH